MREIKFRAWNGAKMITDTTVGKFGNFYVNPGKDKDGLMDNDKASLTVCTTKYPDTVPVMQYTGLKDKNGTEIYEGDVVRYQYPQKQLSKHQQLCQIVYEPKAAAFLLEARHFEPQVKYLGGIAKSNRQYDTRTYELCEVIGNIYENPELLQ